MFELPMLVVTWSRKARSPIMRADDARQAGPLTRGSIGAGGGGAGTSGTDTAGDGPCTREGADGDGRLDGVEAGVGGGGVRVGGQ